MRSNVVFPVGTVRPCVKKPHATSQPHKGDPTKVAQQSAARQEKSPEQTRTSNPRLKLRLLETTDIHGHLLPFNYYTNQGEQPTGLARVATLITQARHEVENCLLFDNGDFLQGSPLADLTAQKNNGWTGPNPVICAMNHIGYDVVGLGNHEFNFGLPALNEALDHADFPVTCANVTDRATGAPSFATFQILSRRLNDETGGAHDLRIAVIGLVPPQVVIWDRNQLCDLVDVHGITETARRVVPMARKAGADLVIALAHTGISPGPDSPDQENAALELARVPGLDAVLAGHSHQVFPSATHSDVPGVDAVASTLNDTPAIMAGFAGSHLGVLDLTLSRGPSGWHVTAHRAEARPVAPKDGHTVPPDPALSATLEKAHQHTLALIETPLNTANAPLHSYLATVRTDPTLQLVNRAQAHALARAITGTPDAQLPVLSATAPFKTGGRSGPHYYTDIPQGPVRLRNAADLYGFPNTLVGARITGSRLRDWLERAASCFHTLIPGQQGQALWDARMPGHAFDVIDGITYRIDLSQPPRYGPDGQLANADATRVRELRHNAKPVSEDDRFLIATNSYRAFGGGPYTTLPDDDIVLKGATPVRDILAAFIRDHGPISDHVTPVWAFTALPDTTAIHLTGPGLRAYPQTIANLGAVDLGDTAEGFMRLQLPLDTPRSPHHLRIHAKATR